MNLVWWSRSVFSRVYRSAMRKRSGKLFCHTNPAGALFSKFWVRLCQRVNDNIKTSNTNYVYVFTYQDMGVCCSIHGLNTWPNVKHLTSFLHEFQITPKPYVKKHLDNNYIPWGWQMERFPYVLYDSLFLVVAHNEHIPNTNDVQFKGKCIFSSLSFWFLML